MKLILLIFLSALHFNLKAPPLPIQCDPHKTYIFSLYVYESYHQQQMYDYVYEVTGLNIKNVNLHHLLLMKEQADLYNIPHRIMFRLVFKESSYRPYITSPKNAYSYMQVIPSTFTLYAKKIGYLGEHTPEINIVIGTKVLSDLYSYWGDWELALSSYNAGKKKVMRYKGIPPYKETKDFVKFIMS